MFSEEERLFGTLGFSLRSKPMNTLHNFRSQCCIPAEICFLWFETVQPVLYLWWLQHNMVHFENGEAHLHESAESLKSSGNTLRGIRINTIKILMATSLTASLLKIAEKKHPMLEIYSSIFWKGEKGLPRGKEVWLLSLPCYILQCTFPSKNLWLTPLFIFNWQTANSLKCLWRYVLFCHSHNCAGCMAGLSDPTKWSPANQMILWFCGITLHRICCTILTSYLAQDIIVVYTRQ